MKKITILITILAVVFAANAQNELYNNGALLYIGSDATIEVNGSFTNTGTGVDFQNNGNITTGSVVNDQVMSSYTGKLILNGTVLQTLSGASHFLTKDLEINNTAGITLNTGLKVDGTCTFITGIITAGDATAPLWFTATGTYTGVSDASHVNGYVVKEGTGNFSYPVGDAAVHQKVDVNLTSNASGMRVRYYDTDAGTGSFLTTGSEPIALVSYNKQEYWDINPVSTASGVVTVFWDGYKDDYLNLVSERKVAHKVSTSWLNEGNTTTGTVSSGSATSNTVSTWSPFTIGTISNALPLTWLSVSGSWNAQKFAVIKWKVIETGVTNYKIERSPDAGMFNNIGSIVSKGDGTNNYEFIDAHPLTGRSFYRIRQTDKDGKHTWSKVVSVTEGGSVTLKVYPTLFTTAITVVSNKQQQAVLLNEQGSPVLKTNLQPGENRLNTSVLSKGVYVLKTASNETIKLIKQ